MDFSNDKLIEILKKNKKFKAKDIKKWIEAADKDSLSLYDYLIAKEIINGDDLGQIVADAMGVKYINLDKSKIVAEVLKSVPEIVSKKNNVVVFAKDSDGLHIAMSDPTDEEFLRNFKKRVDEKIIVYFAHPKRIISLLQEMHNSHNEVFDNLIQDVLGKHGSNIRAEDLPIIQLVDKLLEFGYINKASDLHIEPFEDKTVIRFRIDGILHDISVIPNTLHDLLVTRIKILSRLRTDEHRAAQDGKLKFNFEKEKVDVRVSIVPVVNGEKVVLRLLSEKSRQYDLESLGFREKDLEIIKDHADKPWGMILATGPTGCGKTTTLYAIIKRLNTREVNISTIEDPVEYDMEGVNQIQVNPKTDLTFAKGLRSIVRQDPDIIMVGEIRDEETAKIAINSAMTGHMVLSTLHTNDSATTLPRLLDMGIQPFLVASTINLVIAQRLVRKICDKCKEKSTMTEIISEVIKKEFSTELIKKYKLDDFKTILYKGRGCDYCQNTGYKGRAGTYELLIIDDEIRELVMAKANSDVIEAKAVEKGMLPLIEDGILKVLSGVTTIDELLRVAKE